MAIKIITREIRTILYVCAAVLVFYFFLGRVIPRPECAPCPECNVNCGPKEYVQQNFTKYVCPDRTIVTNLSDCFSQLPELNPLTKFENNSLTKSIIIKPACVAGKRGGYIFYEVQAPAHTVTYLVREQNTNYTTRLKEKGYLNAHRYFTICDVTCPREGDFKLEANKRFLLKLEFNRTALYNRTEYSNEYIIDLTPKSDYMTKNC
ncbi:MAG: hypothetical protein ABIG95_02200 [Candidatus Woesearchaeota archaeon]